MRQNVGRLDAFFRISLGLLLFGAGLKSRSPSRSLLMIALGANKVAEGLTRYCPVLDLLGADTLDDLDASGDKAGALPAGYTPLGRSPYAAHPDDGLLDEEESEERGSRTGGRGGRGWAR